MIYKTYLSKLNPNASENAFYCQPLVKPKDGIWYSANVVGHNKLSIVVKTIMTRAEFKGFYTNHSFRATTATRLFQNEISDQLIMQQTGHRNDVVFSYKQ